MLSRVTAFVVICYNSARKLVEIKYAACTVYSVSARSFMDEDTKTQRDVEVTELVPWSVFLWGSQEEHFREVLNEGGVGQGEQEGPAALPPPPPHRHCSQHVVAVGRMLELLA